MHLYLLSTKNILELGSANCKYLQATKFQWWPDVVTCQNKSEKTRSWKQFRRSPSDWLVRIFENTVMHCPGIDKLLNTELLDTLFQTCGEADNPSSTIIQRVGVCSAKSNGSKPVALFTRSTETFGLS